MNDRAVTGTFTVTLHVSADKVAAVLQGIAADSKLSSGLAKSAWPGRFLLLGRNPVGTLPMFGIIAVDPVIERDVALSHEDCVSPNERLSTTECTLTVETRLDPTLRPLHWTKSVYLRQCNAAAAIIGRDVVAQIEKDLTL